MEAWDYSSCLYQQLINLCAPVPGIRDLPRSPHLWRRWTSSCLYQQLINLCAQYLVYTGLTPEPSPVEVWGLFMSLSTVDKSLCPVPDIPDLSRSSHLWRRGASACLYQQLINLYAPVPGIRDLPRSPYLWRHGASSCLCLQLINLCAQYLVYGTYPGAPPAEGWGYSSCLYQQLINLYA